MTLDRELVAIQGDAAHIETNNHSVLTAMNDSRLGQPRAAAYDTTRPETEVWCDKHERGVHKCRDENLMCDGYTFEIHDPTGEAGIRAAMGQDRAAIDKRAYTKAITAAAKFIREARAIADRYVPPLSVRIPSLDDDELDELWCRSCKRNAGHCEPVSDNYRGKHLCRWCGDRLAEWGTLPPLAILQKRQAGDRIYDRDIERALGRRKAS